MQESVLRFVVLASVAALLAFGHFAELPNSLGDVATATVEINNSFGRE
jgi:hypothetical protein